MKSRSGLVQVCCNLATMTHPLFDKQPVPYALSPKVSNPRSMEAALETAVDMLSKVCTSCTCLLQLSRGASPQAAATSCTAA